LNVNKPFQTLTRTLALAQLHANACMGHVLQSSLVPRTILLKAGTEAISEPGSRSLIVQQSAIYFALFCV